jgi:hypothetical protein
MRMHSTALSIRSIQFLALLVLGSCGTILCAQTVDIKLVNGRNGCPMTDACVSVWMGNERKTAMAIPTDESGIPRLRLTHNDSEIDIHNRWKGCGDFWSCQPCREIRRFSAYTCWLCIMPTAQT